MKPKDRKRYDNHYQQLLKCLKLQGKADVTIDSYSRAFRRVSEHFDCLPEKLTQEHLKDYFAALVDSHSWSTVKIDRLGLQFYWRHVLNIEWQWVNIVKPPVVKTIPDILTVSEIERMIASPAGCVIVFLFYSPTHWACASKRRLHYKWVILMPKKCRFTFDVVKAIKIAYFPCPI